MQGEQLLINELFKNMIKEYKRTIKTYKVIIYILSFIALFEFLLLL